MKYVTYYSIVQSLIITETNITINCFENMNFLTFLKNCSYKATAVHV